MTNNKKYPVEGARPASGAMFCLVSDAEIFRRLDDKFDEMRQDIRRMEGRLSQEIRETERRLGSRIRELEADVRDISSIKGAVQRMNVGFQEIPYEMTGRAAVEEIKDYY
jgi:nucleoside-triphosphatase THEP1